jgi:hypothetical protein
MEEIHVGSKTAVFWDIFRVVKKKGDVVWDKSPFGSTKKNRRFGGIYSCNRREEYPRKQRSSTLQSIPLCGG